MYTSQKFTPSFRVMFCLVVVAMLECKRCRGHAEEKMSSFSPAALKSNSAPAEVGLGGRIIKLPSVSRDLPSYADTAPMVTHSRDIPSTLIPHLKFISAPEKFAELSYESYHHHRKQVYPSQNIQFTHQMKTSAPFRWIRLIFHCHLDGRRHYNQRQTVSGGPRLLSSDWTPRRLS